MRLSAYLLSIFSYSKPILPFKIGLKTLSMAPKFIPKKALI